MIHETFSVDFHGHRLVADIFPAETKPQWLFLHGAGGSNRARYTKLRELFASTNVPTCAFDFIGHGDTGGSLDASSLENRTQQALAIIEALEFNQPISIVAGSMSGYTAIKLTEIVPVGRLVLFVPAVRAYRLPFGPVFSEVIREPESWRQSDAWNILSRYTGKLLIVSAGQDEVVPREVATEIYRCSTSASFLEILEIKDAPHGLVNWLNERDNELRSVFEAIKTAMTVKQFGEKIRDVIYVERQGAYEIIKNSEGKLLVLDVQGKKSSSYFLPGGGVESNERPEDALRREIYEETGLRVSSMKLIGKANQYVSANGEFVNKLGSFYAVEVTNAVAMQRESDHVPQWVTFEEFRSRAAHEAQVWAVENL